MNYNEESLKLHEKYKGKLQITGKIPLKTQDDLSLAYTPALQSHAVKYIPIAMTFIDIPPKGIWLRWSQMVARCWDWVILAPKPQCL